MKSRPIAWPQILCLLMVFLIAGCGGGQKAIRLDGRINVAGNVNPGSHGIPSPIVVRVYQLRSAGVFQSADFFSLYDQDSAALGQDLLAREELTLRPGDILPFQRELDPATRYIGVIAAFRSLETARWRSILEIPPKADSVPLQIELSESAVSISGGK